MSPNEERMWGLWSHLGALVAVIVTGFLGWVPPLIIMQTRGRDSFVRNEAVESLNFQLSLLIVNFGSIFLIIVLIWTIIVPILVGISIVAIDIAALVLMILASVSGNRGEPYRYPLNFRMVK